MRSASASSPGYVDDATWPRSRRCRVAPRSSAGLIAALCLVLVAERSGAVEVAGTAGQLRLNGYLDFLAIVATDDSPRQLPQGLLDLRLEARPALRWLRGYVELRGRAGGPLEDGDPGVYDLLHAFQRRTPSLEINEAYAEVLLRRFELRAGIQKVAWGKLDGLPPSDVLNPRDYHDPFVWDLEERKIGIPALLATYYLPALPRFDLSELRATLVYVPLAVPPRLGLLEERWFPESVAVASEVFITKEALSEAFEIPFSRGLVVPVRFRTLNRRPPNDLEAGGLAFRLGGTFRSADWDVYHYSGPDTGPTLDLKTRAFLIQQSGDAPLALRAVADLVQSHERIHMTAADLAVAFGGVTMRAEAAVFQNRPFLRRAGDLFSPEALADLPLRRVGQKLLKNGRARVPIGDLFVDRDAVDWGIGADYLIEGYQPLLQVSQTALLESAPRLLIANPETRLSGTLRKRFMQDRLELEVRGLYAIERGSWLLFPRISYTPFDNLRLRVGYLAINGPRASLLGQFRKNDEVVFQARYTF